MFLRCTRARFDPAKVDEVMATGDDLKATLGRLPGIQHPTARSTSGACRK